MKFVKGISLFFIYPVFMLCIGFYAGVTFSDYFYPNRGQEPFDQPENVTPAEQEESPQGLQTEPEQSEYREEGLDFDVASDGSGELLEAAAASETLCVETKYVLEERDIYGNITVVTTEKLPQKYIGMNREEFLEAMELYEAFPPLSERKRGFVDLEVTSFSRKRVVVQMNYRYVQPTGSFYLGVYDNKLVVYLEDQENVFIDKDIRLDMLPDEIQRDIINLLWIEDEESLYDFLEAYSS